MEAATVKEAMARAPRPVLVDQTPDDEHDVIVAELESQNAALRTALTQAYDERNLALRAVEQQTMVATHLSAYCEQLAAWKKNVEAVLADLRKHL